MSEILLKYSNLICKYSYNPKINTVVIHIMITFKRSSIILVYPNGESERYNLRNFGSNRSDLYPGTVIYIPRDLTFMEGTDLARAIAPILSSLAISLASLNSISNN